MEITRLEFKAYLQCQESGVTNMFDVRNVECITALKRDKILFIIKNYDTLLKQHGGI